MTSAADPAITVGGTFGETLVSRAQERARVAVLERFDLVDAVRRHAST